MATRTLLIIEDDPQYAELLLAMLKLRRWNPVAALSMAAAFDILKRQKADATILDLSLPDSDTLTSLEQIPVLKESGAGRVIIITGAEVTQNLILLAKISGADGIICKDDLRVQGSLGRFL